MRLYEEHFSESDYRSPYQHDRDRIIHSLAFKRLKDKTQVFAPEKSDHLRNRLSHTLEVSQLSRTVARALDLDEDLAEAIALGHDLGHSPFGHSGESVLNHILLGDIEIKGSDRVAIKQAGGFKHNYQSIRIVDSIEKKYSEFDGLNLTHKVREGILKHTSVKGKYYNLFFYDGLNIDTVKSFAEAEIVAITDEIAQQCHDLEDGIRLKLASISQLRDTEIYSIPEIRKVIDKGDSYQVMNDLIRTLFNVFISDIVEGDRNKGFTFSKDLAGSFVSLKEFVYHSIIFSRDVARSDHVANLVITNLFSAFYSNPRLLPDYILWRIEKSCAVPFIRRLSFSEQKKVTEQLKSCDKFVRIIADYISGMTDAYAIKEYKQLNI